MLLLHYARASKREKKHFEYIKKKWGKEISVNQQKFIVPEECGNFATRGRYVKPLRFELVIHLRENYQNFATLRLKWSSTVSTDSLQDSGKESESAPPLNLTAFEHGLLLLLDLKDRKSNYVPYACRIS